MLCALCEFSFDEGSSVSPHTVPTSHLGVKATGLETDKFNHPTYHIWWCHLHRQDLYRPVTLRHWAPLCSCKYKQQWWFSAWAWTAWWWEGNHHSSSGKRPHLTAAGQWSLKVNALGEATWCLQNVSIPETACVLHLQQCVLPAHTPCLCSLLCSRQMTSTLSEQVCLLSPPLCTITYIFFSKSLLTCKSLFTSSSYSKWKTTGRLAQSWRLTKCWRGPGFHPQAPQLEKKKFNINKHMDENQCLRRS